MRRQMKKNKTLKYFNKLKLTCQIIEGSRWALEFYVVGCAIRAVVTLWT